MHTLFASKVRAGLAAGALALGVVAVAVPAQAQQPKMTALIPFAFETGSQHMDSGKYAVGENGPVMVLTNETTGKTNLVMTHADEKLGASTSSKLVFHRVGDRYYLKQVWTRGNSEGRELPTSRSEKEAQIAQTEAPRSNVIVALNRIPR